MKIIYHTGTGTWFSLDDGCVVIDTYDLPDKESDLLDVLEDSEVVEKHGRRFDICYIDAMQAIHLTPFAIRDEAAAYLDVYGDDESLSEAMRWALSATDDQLEEVCGEVQSDETLWMQFAYSVREAIYQKHENTNKETL